MHTFEIGKAYKITSETMTGEIVKGNDRVVKRTATSVWFENAGRQKLFFSVCHKRGQCETVGIGKTAADNRRIRAYNPK